MSEEKKVNNTPETEEEQYDLNDDRRVKVLSPGALVRRRFFRNRVAVVGLAILVFMFVFSFIGGMISPYSEDQIFYRDDIQNKNYAAITENTDFRYYSYDSSVYSSAAQAQTMLAISKGNSSFTYSGTTYTVTKNGEDFYEVYVGSERVGYVFKDILSASVSGTKLSEEFSYEALRANANSETTFTADGAAYTIDESGDILDASGKSYAYVSRYVVRAIMSDVFLSKEIKDALLEAVETGDTEFKFTDSDGVEYEYTLVYNPNNKQWDVKQAKETRVFDTYSYPSKEHWLGTDKNGMDMLTRLMYGGRVSLVIGFIVEIISTVLGVIFGGISGYFGGWVDMLIMRVVDVFYCVPSMPLIIILGAAMDKMNVDPTLRMGYLMLILGFLGWPGLARMVRGQILSLREQEYMTAAEATGLSTYRRIFKHLVPNVIPQLIVSCTMGLGSTIITEATLSFLGLGVKFPFASWGNIINDVNNTFVLTNYWFIWIPAGTLLLLTVLAFNLVGDGLRDAFDPRMKR